MANSIRTLVAALLVGTGAFAFLIFWMHASPVFALAIGALLGATVLAVSGPGAESDREADRAWAQAAPDLPPHSERAAMERDQQWLRGPAEPADAGDGDAAADGEDGAANREDVAT